MEIDLNKWARYEGTYHPDHAWLLSPVDSWHKNPSYHGPPVPHPEDNEARMTAEELEEYWKVDSEAMTPEERKKEEREHYARLEEEAKENID